jgi:excisionase family DNA binding protein
MRVAEVAERLKISSAKVYALVEKGSLPHFRFDGAIRISEEQLQEYMNSCRHGRRMEDWPEKTNPLKKDGPQLRFTK